MEESETHAVHHEEHSTGRRPMSFANWIGMLLLLGAIAFYLFFAIPEFIGIVSGSPMRFG
jgi:hypothetical protein